jgi:mono/diheme cytochrome c family protein
MTADEEREAIVKYLRSEADRMDRRQAYTKEDVALTRALAEEIETGHHHDHRR